MSKKIFKILFLAFTISILSSCANTSSISNSSGKYDRMYYMTSYQLSAEGQGLMMQAFNSAKRRIENIIKMANDLNIKEWSYKIVDGKKKLYHNSLPAAIVSDIDDTLVNGSNYAAKIIGNNGDWNNAAFARFVDSSNCTALPGSVDFVNFCISNGIDFYYVTNRYDQGYKIGQKDSISSYEKSIEGSGKGNYTKADGTEIGSSIYQVMGKSFYDITLTSMKRLGFTISDKNLLVNDSKLNGSSKEKMRDAIRNGCKDFPNGVRRGENTTDSAYYFSCEPHDIIMLLGDQSTDFTDDLTNSDMDAVKRADKAIELSDKWGEEWILLPNGVYGTSQDFATRYGYEELFTHYANVK